MNQQILDYLKKNRDEYGLEALKQGLIDKGYSEGEVGEAVDFIKSREKPKVSNKKITTSVLIIIIVLSTLSIAIFYLVSSSNEVPSDACEDIIGTIVQIDGNIKGLIGSFRDMIKFEDLYIEECKTDWIRAKDEVDCENYESILPNSNRYCLSFFGAFGKNQKDPSIIRSVYYAANNEDCDSIVDKEFSDLTKHDKRTMKDHCNWVRALLENDESRCNNQEGCLVTFRSVHNTCEKFDINHAYNDCLYRRMGRHTDESVCSKMKEELDSEGNVYHTKESKVEMCNYLLEEYKNLDEDLVLYDKTSCDSKSSKFPCLEIEKVDQGIRVLMMNNVIYPLWNSSTVFDPIRVSIVSISGSNDYTDYDVCKLEMPEVETWNLGETMEWFVPCEQWSDKRIHPLAIKFRAHGDLKPDSELSFELNAVIVE